MAYLQLAAGPPAAKRQPPPIHDLYVRMPDGMLIREDQFDDLPDDEWYALMEYSYDGFGMSGKILDRMRARKDRRQERRDKRNNSKSEARLVKAQGGGLLTRVGNAVGGVLEKINGGGTPAAAPEMEYRDIPDISYSAGNGLQIKPPPADKEWYEKPEIMIPLGLAVLGVGAVAFKQFSK